MNKTPTALIIMDGFGLSDAVDGNAIRAAKTPCLDQLFAEYAHTTLSASGLDVGLPEGQMGNSEVGHTNIGGGRVVFQDLPRITRSIEDGSFFQNEAYLRAMDQCLSKGTSLHLFGLLSTGGVHSHLNHLWALLKLAREKGLEKVYIHAFLDGRDTSPTSGAGFLEECVSKCAEIGVGKVATVMGRYYAMDRDKRWERLEAAYDAMVYGEGAAANPDPVAAVKASYEKGVTDEFVEPVVCDSDGCVGDNDSIIFFNFRPDRAREITRAFVDPEFDGFTHQYFPVTFVCNTEYDASMPNVEVAFPRIRVENGLGEYLSKLGLTQLRIAETEKYAHVTFFFNGGVETVFPGEDRVLVPSPKVPTYDMQPEMSAVEVCDKCVERIESGAYDVIILNFANCDMVGHTGVFDAAVKAVETVDECVGRVVNATLKMGGIAMVTADHGNAEQMKQSDGSPMTAHSTNPVPFILCGAGAELRSGRLADIAPTILDVMGLQCPQEMDGKTLIIK
ncbi:2,3-bisphosphoglycerate-independent phosphoglycerate mutase [Oscillibacter sp. MSJ-2]|uniref:2,3-bisphosphoglycerate-independent phosphoglycerate mutase n=1 Tax=Dysosmobacter acutus TaxID=2841504 RepID=A0ABS6F8F6_9FIRM|nr:2,3-bisphosphoglycerate-independent phosphoglycerate mutase [Dysosmobacter acutus]MBU5625584.1 2,3-bisphosphoglycerate-independent phosphoglycerate mutase [Dysosmobacter acutus]